MHPESGWENTHRNQKFVNINKFDDVYQVVNGLKKVRE